MYYLPEIFIVFAIQFLESITWKDQREKKRERRGKNLFISKSKCPEGKHWCPEIIV